MFAITVPAGAAGAGGAGAAGAGAAAATVGTTAAGAEVVVAGALVCEVVVVPGFELEVALAALDPAAAVLAAELVDVPVINDFVAFPPEPQPTTEAIATIAALNFMIALGLKLTGHLGFKVLQLTESKVGRDLLCLYRGAGVGVPGKTLRGFSVIPLAR